MSCEAIRISCRLELIDAGNSVVDPATGVVLSHSGRVTDICQLLR